MRLHMGLSAFSGGLQLIALAGVILYLNGCATTRVAHEERQPVPLQLETDIQRQDFPVAAGEDVIGGMAAMGLEDGDTLPDIARHFGLGVNEISAANPGVDRWVPAAGTRLLLPLSFILPDAPRKGIVINLAAMRLFRYRGDGGSLAVSTYPVGVGTEERPSPTGLMHVERKVVRPTWHVPASIAADHRKKGDPLPPAVAPGPQNPLGEYALYLSRPSYLIHGTNKPASIGLRATNGCIRLYPEDVEKLFRDTPPGTPVNIVNQPYLLGRRGGVFYLAVHTPTEDLDADELYKIYRRLRNIEKETGLSIEWDRVRKVLAEASGVPVPIFGMKEGSEGAVEETVELMRPARLHGRPEIPAMDAGAWYVLAAEVPEKPDALRLAAIINHQGPQIPARVLPETDGYRVVAGPFADRKEAREAVRRLKTDLEVDGSVIEPDSKLAGKEVNAR